MISNYSLRAVSHRLGQYLNSACFHPRHFTLADFMFTSVQLILARLNSKQLPVSLSDFYCHCHTCMCIILLHLFSRPWIDLSSNLSPAWCPHGWQCQHTLQLKYIMPFTVIYFIYTSNYKNLKAHNYFGPWRQHPPRSVAQKSFKIHDVLFLELHCKESKSKFGIQKFFRSDSLLC